MLKHLLALIIFSLLLISCGDNNNDPVKNLSDKEKYSFDSTDLKTEGIDNSGKPFIMEYKFKTGDKYLYRLTSISSNTQSMQVLDSTMTNVLDQKIIYLFDLLIKDVDKDGVTEADININFLKMDVNANGKSYLFEAGKEKDTSKIKQFSEFQSLFNNPFSIRFTKFGEILEIFKVDKIVDKIFEINEVPDTIASNNKSLIKPDIINKILQPIVLQVIRKTPEKEVYKDSIWQIKQPPFKVTVYQINFVNKYKVSSVEKLDGDRIAVIDAGTDLSYSGNSKVKERGVEYTFQKPMSTAEGKLYFDVDKGLQIKSRTKTKFESAFSFEGMTPQGQQKGKQHEGSTSTSILELIQ